MVNLNKFFILFAIFSGSACAGDMVTFDKPDLVIFDDAAGLSGFYSATDGKRSCTFLFAEGGSSGEFNGNKYFSRTKILTFLPDNKSLLFSNRHKDFDIDGVLYRRDDEWVIKTSRTQAGCGNAEGVFEFDPGDLRSVSYFVKNKVPAVGIRLIEEKTNFYNMMDGKFIVRKGYLTRGDGVVVLKTHGQFSYVRYSDPGPDSDGRISTGWVRSADLVNPFPRGSEQ
jgi:hypothetical protein